MKLRNYLCRIRSENDPAHLVSKQIDGLGKHDNIAEGGLQIEKKNMKTLNLADLQFRSEQPAVITRAYVFCGAGTSNVEKL